MQSLALDGRPGLDSLYAAFAPLRQAGWRQHRVTQQAVDDLTVLPIDAWSKGGPADHIVIAGIHGREPAGAVALARSVDRLIDWGHDRRILLLPLLNPWGYLHHQRYGPSGQSVSDSEHWLGRTEQAACADAEAITRYLMEQSAIAPGAAVLDLHEDPVYEAPDYVFEGRGSYVYVAGDGAAEHPITLRIRQALQASTMPLVMQGRTRFGETLDQGLIRNSGDGSVDELLASRKACSPVITTELVLRSQTDPPLQERVAVYCALLEAFFGG
ncbi:hypothetical protein [Paucibacter soli]|uniref:hypothetical protein n=1 Tax=Paucibacter soli TaxID=3133433 RepID=UPI0030978136